MAVAGWYAIATLYSHFTGSYILYLYAGDLLCRLSFLFLVEKGKLRFMRENEKEDRKKGKLHLKNGLKCLKIEITCTPVCLAVCRFVIH